MTATLPPATYADLVAAMCDADGRLVRHETPDGRWALVWDETGWSTVRTSDEVWIKYQPSVEQALRGIATGWADKEADRLAAYLAQLRADGARAMDHDRLRIDAAEDRREGGTDGSDRW